MIMNMATQFLHEDFDLRQCHPRSPGHLHQNVRSVSEHFAFAHKRIFQSLRQRVVRTIIRISFAEAEKAPAILTAQCRE